MSHLDRKTGPSAGSASHIRWRRRGRQEPNCIAFGFWDVSDEALTDGVLSSGAAVELHIRRGFLFFWSTEASRDILRRVPKYLRASFLVRMILKPRSVLWRSSSLTNCAESLVCVDLWGPVAIPARMEVIGQGGPIDAGKPSVAYELRRSAAGCGVEVGARTIGC